MSSFFVLFFFLVERGWWYLYNVLHASEDMRATGNLNVPPATQYYTLLITAMIHGSNHFVPLV